MKYQIESFILDTTARTLTQGDTVKNIRPKTLSLLLLLADKAEQVISKNELLATIWDDVSVDEGVIFQSVRDIRQLFDNNNIIQNYPRKGYAFTGKISPVEQLVPLDEPQINTTKHILSTYKLYIMLAALFIAVSIWFSKTDEVDGEFDHRVLVLPIKSKVSYEEKNWIYLGGMEQLIAQLKGLPSSVFVYQGTDIPHLMHVAGMKRIFSSSNVAKIFNVSGSSVVVETEFYGDVSDYKLVYKIHTLNDVKQGVVLDITIGGAISQLADKLAAFVNLPINSHQFKPRQEFSDALFAEAIISYESDWKSSISFFESYLALNPQSVIAMIYLSKLYVWQDKLELANKLLTLALTIEGSKTEDRIQLMLIQGRIHAKKSNYQEALLSFNQAESDAEAHSYWSIKANVAEEIGKSYFAIEKYTQAHQAFKRAMSFYQIIKSPIGINATRLHLSRVLRMLGNLEESNVFYKKAEQDIKRIELDFLYKMLEEHKQIF